MEGPDDLPSAFAQVKKSLDPFIKTRREVSKIRQVLTAYLNAQVTCTAESGASVLALSNASFHVKTTNSLTGLRKEYLKTLRLNIEAHQKYDFVSRGNGSPRNKPKTHSVVSTEPMLNKTTSMLNTDDNLERYITLVELRQRHERLCILQNYIIGLPNGSAITMPSLEEAANLTPLPRIPADVISNLPASSHQSAQVYLRDHTRNLEKAVFQSKILLRSEKEALEKATIRSKKRSTIISVPGPDTERFERLRALSRTRDELIKWIEEELGKAGDSATQSGDEKQSLPTPRRESLADGQLNLIKNQYAGYVALRKDFLDAICPLVDLQVPPKHDDILEGESDRQGKEMAESTASTIPQHLEDFLLISNEQKHLIQQRAHISVSLAKQHKETIRLFDRLSEESQLLSTFPSLSPGDLAYKDMASPPYRAYSWTVAANSANMATNETVNNNIEEGKIAAEEARQVLSNLSDLMGKDAVDCTYENNDSGDIWVADVTSQRSAAQLSRRSKSTLPSGSIWNLLDGSLGVLKRDQHNYT